jgi:ABC-2 type transport system ATP-binding protein
MDEAERLCDRVAVVDHGQVIALGTPRELIARVGGQHVITFSVAHARIATFDLLEFRRLPSVQMAWAEQETMCLSVAEPHVALPALLDELRRRGLELATLATRHATLEDVFVSLTGRHLREQEANAA